jgi:hypothetical protein
MAACMRVEERLKGSGNFRSWKHRLEKILDENTLGLNLKYKFIAANTSLLFNLIHNATKENKYQTSVLHATMFSP